MPKPPIQKTVHTDSIKTSVRIPRELHEQLQAAADRDARSLNAEILVRLQSSPFDEIKRQNEEIKLMLRMLMSRE